jgi:hypothetical protein
VRRKLVRRLGIASASAALCFAIARSELAEAASFTFKLLSGNGVATGEGVLYFEKPDIPDFKGLSGIGREKINFNDFHELYQGQVGFDYKYTIPNTTATSFTKVPWGGNPTFYFDSGNLIGMDLDSQTVPFDYGDCRDFPCSVFIGTISYSIRGNSSQELWIGTRQLIPNPFDPPEETPVNDFFNPGTIAFTTIEPIPPDRAAIPEPMTVLGVGTAIGFGALFKRKLAR